MAISQPTYPVETNELVTHVGSYTDTQLSGHTGDATAAHAASAISFSATGTIAADDVQEAVAEVASEAASNLSTHSSDTTSVHGIADTSALATSTDVSTAVSNHSSDTTSVHGITDTSDLILEGDARLDDDRTPSDASVTEAKLHADLKAALPGVNVFDTTWPTRPTGWAYVIWMGGDASDDDPSADMEVNDLWFPDSE